MRAEGWTKASPLPEVTRTEFPKPKREGKKEGEITLEGGEVTDLNADNQAAGKTGPDDERLHYVERAQRRRQLVVHLQIISDRVRKSARPVPRHPCPNTFQSRSCKQGQTSRLAAQGHLGVKEVSRWLSGQKFLSIILRSVFLTAVMRTERSLKTGQTPDMPRKWGHGLKPSPLGRAWHRHVPLRCPVASCGPNP